MTDGGDKSGVRRVSFDVPGMDCPSCAEKVEKSLGKTGVEDCETNPTTGTVEVSFSREFDESRFQRAIEGAGYDVTDVRDVTSEGGDLAPEMDIWTSERAIKTWISGVFLFAGLVFKFLVSDPLIFSVGVGFTASDLLFLVSTGFGAQVIFRNGYYSVRNLNLDIDLLMTIAIVGAVTASLVSSKSLYLEGATLAFMFSVAELLEKDSMKKARNSLRELMELSPDEARVRRDGVEETVEVDEVEVDDVVLVEPGEKIPVDGDVVKGGSAVNESAVTG